MGVFWFERAHEQGERHTTCALGTGARDSDVQRNYHISTVCDGYETTKKKLKVLDNDNTRGNFVTVYGVGKKKRSLRG